MATIPTVDGRNPAPVEGGSLCHFLQGFINPWWLAGFLPSTVGKGNTSEVIQVYIEMGSKWLTPADQGVLLKHDQIPLSFLSSHVLGVVGFLGMNPSTLSVWGGGRELGKRYFGTMHVMLQCHPTIISSSSEVINTPAKYVGPQVLLVGS